MEFLHVTSFKCLSTCIHHLFKCVYHIVNTHIATACVLCLWKSIYSVFKVHGAMNGGVKWYIWVGGMHMGWFYNSWKQIGPTLSITFTVSLSECRYTVKLQLDMFGHMLALWIKCDKITAYSALHVYIFGTLCVMCVNSSYWSGY